MNATIYLSSREVEAAGKRARRCESCSSTWLADTEADYDEFDVADQATVAPHKEDCPPCVVWFANLHLTNPALGEDGVGLNAFRRKYVTAS